MISENELKVACFEPDEREVKVCTFLERDRERARGIIFGGLLENFQNCRTKL